MNDKFKDVIDKYIQKSLLDPSSLYFLANGKQINQEETVEKLMSNMNKQNQILKVLVQLIEDENINLKKLEKSKDVICPKCLEPCRIQIEDFKLKLFGCIKNHTSNIIVKDFPKTQKIDNSNIVCEKCKIKNKGNSPDNEFYICLTCNLNLCLLCKPHHNSNHCIIKYTQKNYICKKHHEPFIKYCSQCNINICFSCDEEHDKHKTIFLGDLKPNMDEAKNKMIEIKKEIQLFKNNIEEIINKLIELIDAINIYYKINNDIINSYEKQNRNYQILQNLKIITTNNKIFGAINNINKITNTKDKIFNIIDLYNNLNSNNSDIKLERKDLANKNNSNINDLSFNQLSQITIIYNIDKNDNKIKIFGKNFVRNNKNNCYLIIDQKQNDLSEYYTLNNYQKSKNILEIRLIKIKPIII